MVCNIFVDKCSPPGH